MTITIESVNRPARGEKVSGDTLVILPHDGFTLIALADGLGHGPMAMEASKAFCDHICTLPPDAEWMTFEELQGAGFKTRGVAAAILKVDEVKGTVSYSGVGNIELQSVSRVKIRPVSSPGIIGRPVRKYLHFEYELSDGDLLALYSDGISSRFQLSEYRRLPAKECAETILANHGKHHDDATCIIVRYKREITKVTAKPT